MKIQNDKQQYKLTDGGELCCFFFIEYILTYDGRSSGAMAIKKFLKLFWGNRISGKVQRRRR